MQGKSLNLPNRKLIKELNWLNGVFPGQVIATKFIGVQNIMLS
jgi:hypothetical protein